MSFSLTIGIALSLKRLSKVLLTFKALFLCSVSSLPFVETISPMPSFIKWLEKKSMYEDMDEDSLMTQAILYLTESEREDNSPNDPVAKFHLGNGAILEKINLNADLSEKGLMQSKGLMVNYLYNLELLGFCCRT